VGSTVARAISADRVRWAAEILLLGLVYFGSAKLGLTLAFATPSVTAIWPPAGIALAALVLVGPRLWLGVALGAFLANVTTDVPLYTAIGITIGNTAAALTAALLLRRVGFRPSLERLRDLFSLVLFGGIISTTVAASIGVASLSLGDSLFDDAASVWKLWWLGDMGGDLLVGSLLLVAVTQWPYREVRGRAFEAVALLAGLTGVSLLVFGGDIALAYLTFPFLIWAALRFWQPGAAFASLVTAAIAVAFTANGHGQFVRPSEDDSLLLALTFSVVSGLTALVLAIVSKQRFEADEAMRNIAHTLQEGLLPPQFPAMRQLEVAGWYRPGQREQQVGGDFYDVFQTGPDEWVAVIGDVCGKGPEAASLTALARHTVRALTRRPVEPSTALRDLNRTILEQRQDQRFMTVALARITRTDGTHVVTISNGGHPLPLIVRADGAVEEVGTPGAGALLGVLADPPLSDETVSIGSGDALVLFTDGLVERPDRGSGWLLDSLRGCAGQSAEEIVGRLKDQALNGSTLVRDDVAILVLART
jgi:integral membrane sensor domain MASE1